MDCGCSVHTACGCGADNYHVYACKSVTCRNVHCQKARSARKRRSLMEAAQFYKPNYTKFLTLSLRNVFPWEYGDMTFRRKINVRIRRLMDFLGAENYVCTVEATKGQVDARVHYHFHLCGEWKYVQQNLILDEWRENLSTIRRYNRDGTRFHEDLGGGVNIQVVKYSVIGYLSKYMAKSGHFSEDETKRAVVVPGMRTFYIRGRREKFVEQFYSKKPCDCSKLRVENVDVISNSDGEVVLDCSKTYDFDTVGRLDDGTFIQVYDGIRGPAIDIPGDIYKIRIENFKGKQKVVVEHCGIGIIERIFINIRYPAQSPIFIEELTALGRQERKAFKLKQVVHLVNTCGGTPKVVGTEKGLCISRMEFPVFSATEENGLVKPVDYEPLRRSISLDSIREEARRDTLSADVRLGVNFVSAWMQGFTQGNELNGVSSDGSLQEFGDFAYPVVPELSDDLIPIKLGDPNLSLQGV